MTAPALPLWMQEFSRCRPWIEAALASSAIKTVTIEEVAGRIARGELQLHPGKESCIVTGIDSYPSGIRTLSVYAAGGRLDELAEMLPGVEAWGRSLGCTHVFVRGRPGWQRSFLTRERGYALDQITLWKALSDDPERSPQ